MPTDLTRRAPEAAIFRVIQELRHREFKLQSELISLRPLVRCALRVSAGDYYQN